MNKNSALITGCAKRIGRQMSLDLASRGYDIAINYNKSHEDALKLCEEIKKIGVKCKIFQADLSKLDEAKKLISEVIKSFPNLNLLINNASIFNKSKFGEDALMLDNFNIHLFSPMILSKEFAKNVLAKKIKNSQIINIVDKNVIRFDSSYFYYLLSKKSLAEFTKMLALQLSPEIRVNAIAPGYILEDIYLQNSPEEAKKIIQKIPLQKKGDVKNILQSLNYLLENDFINGQILFVDGAASLNNAG